MQRNTPGGWFREYFVRMDLLNSPCASVPSTNPAGRLDEGIKPEMFTGDLKSGYPLDFFGLFRGLFRRANSYDHRPEIIFQRISANKFLKFSGWIPTSVLPKSDTFTARNLIIYEGILDFRQLWTPRR